MKNITKENRFIKFGKHLGEYYYIYSFEDLNYPIVYCGDLNHSILYWEAYAGVDDELTTGKCKSEEEAIEKIKDLIKKNYEELEEAKKLYIESSKNRGW